MTADDVKVLRLASGMTQDELARYLGLRHRSQVTHLESGRAKIVGAKLELLKMLQEKISKKSKK